MTTINVKTSLLTVNKDAKTIKNNARNVLTGILYLAPYTLSGYQVCPRSTAGCRAACLFTAGMGAYHNVQQARINRTKKFFEDRKNFLQTLHKDIEKIVNKAKKLGMKAAIRLNGTSDIAWEKFPYEIDGKQYDNLFSAFPKVSFYDYTKILGRRAALSYKNYHLTFSASDTNDDEVKKAIDMGFNISVVFKIGRNDPKPKHYLGLKVVNGDKDDLRFKNKGKQPVIIGLSAKGRARYDETGFVKTVPAEYDRMQTKSVTP